MFLAFTFEEYYPLGGMDDCKGIFTELADAKAKVAQETSGCGYITWQIYDNNKHIIYKFENGDWKEYKCI